MKLKQLSQIFILMMLIQLCPAQNGTDKPSDANLPANDANGTKTIKLFTSLVEGQKETSKDGKPLLLILINNLKSTHSEYLDKLLSDHVLAKVSNESAAVIRINFPLKKNAAEEEVNAVTEFVKKYNLLQKPLQVLMINSKSGEEILRIEPALDSTRTLLNEIVPLLPDRYKGGWITNFEAAKMISEKTGRYVLINFTGSDWCIWCKRLKEEVFDKVGFKKYAKDNLVLVEIDFPRKNSLTKDQQKKNSELAEKFEVRGYPTVIILKPNAEIAGKTGYIEGGEIEFIKGLKQITGK